MRRDRRWVFGPNFVPVITIVVSVTAMLTYGYVVAFAAGPGVSAVAETTETAPPAAPEATTSTSTTTSPTSTTTIPPTTTTSTTQPVAPVSDDPTRGERYVVSADEIEPGVKQLAADVAISLTTYDASDPLIERLSALGPASGIQHLALASEPLIHPGSWSRGEIVYAQLGGLTDDRASVMVVTRQTVGSGDESDVTVVRTLDIRLVHGDWGWRFDFLASAGGTFDSVDDLTLAHSVARNPRIEMPDSARLDILAGRISPDLLRLMDEIAQRTPYAIAVLATGHPHNVFETDRVSHHTVGRALDIYRVGDRLVVDDRGEGSATHELVEWLLDHPDIVQVGSPWDVDDPASIRSFTNLVHQDHIHVAIGTRFEEVGDSG